MKNLDISPLKSVQNHEILINNMSINMPNYFINTFFIEKKIIFQINAENFNAKFLVVLKISQVINSPKYVGIRENYLRVFTECVKRLHDLLQYVT